MYQPFATPEDTYHLIGKRLPKFKLLKKFKTPRYVKYLAIFGFLLIFVSYLPSMIFSILTYGENMWERYISPTQKAKSHFEIVEESNYQPAYDETLPAGSFLKIPSICVDTTISISSYENYEEVLKNGVWRAPDWGTPENRQMPTVLAAHRYGYLKWSRIFRRQNSFFNLTKLAEGDQIEIIWRQRKYTYNVVGSSEGREFANIDADLILFTCRDLTSDVRIFKYAKLLEI